MMKIKNTLALLTLGCLFMSSNLLNAQCHIDDWTALKALYESTDGDNWINDEGWEIVKNDEPPIGCNLNSLYGVSLNSLSRVDRIELSRNNLLGHIPIELQNLSGVSIIRLNNNQLEGHIPNDFVNLLELQIFNVSNNQLNGSLPDFPFNSRISYFDIQSNYFTCEDIKTYPKSFRNFKYAQQKYKHNGIESYSVESLNESIKLSAPFYESGNFTYSWSKNDTLIENANDSILHLNNVQLKDLGVYSHQILYNDCVESNGLDGKISNVAFTSNPIIVSLNNANCHIDDWVALKALYEATDGDNWNNKDGWEVIKYDEPTLVCNLNDLYGVTLGRSGRVIRLFSRNSLNGYIPAELSKLKNLEDIDFTNTKLKGIIPPELGNLSNLEDLELGNNQLTGTIPQELSNLENLKFLYLNNNNLAGNIPSELGDLSAIEVLSLNDNQFSGSIPTTLFNLKNLDRLELQNNELTGNIPIELGIASINDIDFSNNQLTGNIPSEIGNSIYLSILDLSDNQLDGDIPDEIANLRGLAALNLSNNKLTGTLPNALIEFCCLGYVNVSNNMLSGNIPKLQAYFPFGDTAGILTYDISLNNYTCSEIENGIAYVEPSPEYGKTIYSPQNYNHNAEADFSIDSSKKSISLNAPFYMAGNFTYQWYLNETPIDGAIDSVLSLNTVQFYDVGDYTLHIFNAECKNTGMFSLPGIDGLEYISNPISVRRTDLEGCTDVNSCNYNEFAFVDDGSCEYIWCDTMSNPIRIQTTNEVILSDTTIKFDLVIDSLNLDYSADGLTFTLDTRGNYDIVDIKVISPILSTAEVEVKKLYRNPTITINRMNNQRLASGVPILSAIGCLPVADVPTDESTCSHFVISGGTELANGPFIDFDNLYIDVPFSDCSPYRGYGAEGNNWLPLVLTILPQNCNTNVQGLAEIKILQDGQSPFNYILKNEQDIIISEATTNENLIEISDLNAGNYVLTITDSDGKQTQMHTCVPLVANANANETCNTQCVDYVTIPDGAITGKHYAQKEIEIKGYVGKNETVEFSICE